MGDQEKTRQYILLAPGVSSRTPLSDEMVDELRATTPGPPPEVAVYSAKPFTPGAPTLVHTAHTAALTAHQQPGFIHRVQWWLAFIVSFSVCLAIVMVVDRWRTSEKRHQPPVSSPQPDAPTPASKVPLKPALLHQETAQTPEFIAPVVPEQPPGWNFKKKKKHRRHRGN